MTADPPLMARHDEWRLHFEIKVRRTQALLVSVLIHVNCFLGANGHEAGK